ncbi:MAG: FtsW/RodA/SpoVE family cell cycle protein, partial [Muribaculaceae bacterium]|nr:FtsW/RodA/SpoVE family cell cycle protein [Muribaculaceae bacterium]
MYCKGFPLVNPCGGLNLVRHLVEPFGKSVLFTFSVGYFFDNVLAAHQRARINHLLGIEVELQGAGYNVNQSMIAIGSGGLTG